MNEVFLLLFVHKKKTLPAIPDAPPPKNFHFVRIFPLNYRCISDNMPTHVNSIAPAGRPVRQPARRLRSQPPPGLATVGSARPDFGLPGAHLRPAGSDLPALASRRPPHTSYPPHFPAAAQLPISHALRKHRRPKHVRRGGGPRHRQTGHPPGAHVALCACPARAQPGCRRRAIPALPRLPPACRPTRPMSKLPRKRRRAEWRNRA